MDYEAAKASLFELIDKAARARRLSLAIAGHPVAERLEQLADDLDSKVQQRIGELLTHPEIAE